MSKQHLLVQLTEYEKKYHEEINTVQKVADFLKKHDNCFERSCEVGHITGSAWLLNQNRTHVLLTHHKKLDKWLQLGGHADGVTNALEVAITEAKEESGIEDISAISTEIFDIDVHLIPERKDEKAHYHYDVRYLLNTNQTDQFVVSEESHDLKWFDAQELKSLKLETSIKRMVEKWEATHFDAKKTKRS